MPKKPPQRAKNNTGMADTEALRKARVRQLFQARPAEDYSETGVLLFYAWLEKYHPELLPNGRGGAYPHLKVDLHGLYRD